MKIALDLDNTIDSAPAQFQSLMAGLKAAGHYVIVVTGTGDNVASQKDWDEKAQYLTSLGCGQCWDELAVMAHGGTAIADAKAQWMKDKGVDLFIDNSKDNAKAAVAIGVELVLVPWASRF